MIIESELKQDIVEVGRRLYAKGLVASNDGNLSIRISENEVLITPTGVSKGYMSTSDILKVDMDGRVLSGTRKPTSEMKMHLAVYRKRQDIKAIVHAHPPFATAFAVAGQAFDKIALPEAVFSLGHIALADYGTPSTDEVPEAVEKHIEYSDAILLSNHGALTAGIDIYDAYYKMETLEHFANITLHSRLLGGEKALDKEQLSDLFDIKRDVFGKPVIVRDEGSIQAVAAGHICLDIIPEFTEGDPVSLDSVLAPGKLTNIGKARVSTGGSVSNTGIALSVLGIKTKLMGKVGRDLFGDGVLKLIDEKNIDNGIIAVEGEETSYTILVAPPGIDRIILHDPGANDTFCAEEIDYEIVKQAKLFHFGYPTLMKRFYQNDGDELVKMFSKVKELGVTTSLDVSLPDASSEAGKADWKKILQRVLPYVDIFLPSAEEIMYMLQMDPVSSTKEGVSKKGDPLEGFDMNNLQLLGDALIAMGTRIVVIKCGINGYYIRTASREALASIGKAAPDDPDNWADREMIEETFHVDRVISAAGAGDNSIAGFLAALLNGRMIEEAIRIACAVGAQNVRVYDAVSGVRTWEETLAMIPGWEKNRNTIDGDHWIYDPQMGVWRGKSDH